jgi:hypothetical protein
MAPYPADRRTSPRCDVVTNRMSIHFEAPEGRRRVGATLINISRNGALVLAEKAMLRAVPLLIRIDNPVRTGWVDAKVVRFDSSRQIGLHFPTGCPDQLLLAGTVGIDLNSLPRDDASGTTAFD